MAAINSQQEATEWYKIISDWPNYWTSVQRNFQGLLAQSSFIQTQSPEVRKWYDERVNKASALYNKANAINISISKIKSAWDSFTGWLKGMTGMSSLGILPAIPIAITAAGAAATIYEIVTWLKESSNDARTIELLKEARSQGLSPTQAKEIIENRKSGGISDIFGNIRKFIPWILIGGAVILILPRFLEKKQ